MDTSKAKKVERNGSDPTVGGRPPIEVTSWKVENVRVITGAKGDIVFFTLELNGVSIYNCRVATGKDGDFISFPQYKGSDNKWYNSVYAKLSNEYSQEILKSIQDIIKQPQVVVITL